MHAKPETYKKKMVPTWFVFAPAVPLSFARGSVLAKWAVVKGPLFHRWQNSSRCFCVHFLKLFLLRASHVLPRIEDGSVVLQARLSGGAATRKAHHWHRMPFRCQIRFLLGWPRPLVRQDNHLFLLKNKTPRAPPRSVGPRLGN